ncbi:hypothetical protein PLESTB_000014000 [Pleodorina starrii]|uniref:Transmembrane protein 135 N-terminal domain-containing protein n=1 Tax=Pleodorina starrii TaxID=330485 RepID=A0A9W6B8B7_9CHLO|nr:hypothetical protein PLESTM_001120600 [Pleodorina starrii]GLC47674.1 hypothetical protein PLESTB_000014000 [Pleodorina starrii]GLC70915.1 hypothetical protein PLESTF_001046300 [Pleodorina starrii]
MRGEVESNLGSRYRPRHRDLPGDDMEPSFSERGMFEDLELLARTPEIRRAWDRVRTAAIRGAAAGVLIKGGLHTLTFVMYLLSRIRGKGRQRVTTLADALRDTVLHTCFLAALGSSYTAVDEGIALVFGKASTQRWRALLAGLIAGQSLRITGPNRRHYSLATYILLRGLTLLVRTGNKPSAPPALRALLRPTRLQHGDTLLMCVAASQILYSFIMAPSTLPPTYVRFITRMGGKDPTVWAAIREHAMRNSLHLAPGPLRALNGTPMAYLNARPGRLHRTPCEFFHPGQSCAGHAVSVLPQAYSTSLAVYVPFYLVSSVLVHRTALLARPRELLPKLALAVLRSSAFLSAYIAAAFAGACGGFCVAGVNTGPVIAGSVWAGGLGTLLEKKSRRMELAMYCAARALEAFIRCCWLWRADVSGRRRGPPALPPGAAALAAPRHGGPPAGVFGLRPRAVPPGGAAAAAAAAASGGSGGLRLDVLMFSLGCGAIMHCYSDACGQHRDVFRSKYLNVLDFIFGNEGVTEGSISHVPTNLELVSSVSRRLRTMSRGVLSVSGDYGSINSAASTSFHSTLPRSAAHSEADGLGLVSPAGGVSPACAGTGGGHPHHGGHGYSRYLAAQHQRHQQHQALLQQLGSGSGGGRNGGGPGLVERSRSTGEQQEQELEQQGGLRSSMSSGAARGMQGGDERAVASGPASLSGKPPVAPSQSRSPSPSPSPAAVASGVAVAAEAVAAGRSAGGNSSRHSSHSSGEWEDVWAATAGSFSPNVVVAGPIAPSRDASPAAALAATDDDSAVPRVSSDAVVGQGPALRSPFASEGTAPAADAAAAAAPAASTLSWAARLVTGAFHRATPASACDAPPPAAEPAGMWGFARRSSGIRRSSTAPHGLLHHSPQALLLLSDPAAEHCGHGRSSYKELQRLSGGGDALAAMAGVAVAVGGGEEAPSPASTSSTSPAAAEEAAALFSAPSSPPPLRGGDQHGSAPSSPSGRRAAAPSRARPVPVPNATSRTPAFRPRAPLFGAGSSGGDAAAAPLPSRNPAASSSLSSSLYRLAGSSHNSVNDLASSRLSRRIPSSSGDAARRSAGGSALTFEPHGALGHPSPVPRAPVWPRISLETQGGTGAAAVCRSAPEARESALSAALAEAAGEATVRGCLLGAEGAAEAEQGAAEGAD